MTDGREKIKEFFEEKTEEISSRIEKTPMEKFFIFFLILITISAVVLGYLQLKKNIEEPLYSSYLREKRGEIRAKYQVSNLNNTNQIVEASRLQSQDSDLDGLDDYSEIYLYQTSAYLEDSDGDGIWDKQEILAGTDPNCPEGQDCEIQPFKEEDIATFEEQLNLNQADISSGSLDLDTLLDLESQILSGEVSLEELGITDPALQETFDQIASGQYDDLSDLTQEDKDWAKETLKDMTPEEIREELINQGIDKTLLDQIDDQTLEKLFSDLLNQY